MRPKVTILIVVVGMLLVAGSFWLKQPTSPPSAGIPEADSAAASTALAPAPASAAPDSAPDTPAVSGGPIRPTPEPESPVNTPEVPPPMDEAALQARVETLANLAMEDDSASLQIILSELSNPHPTIREAALDAVREFGSRDAIPSLKELAAATQDSRQRQELLETVAYLELPTLTELRARHRQAQPTPPPAPQP